MSFNGKWRMKDVTGAAAYFDAINSPTEHKEKLLQAVETAKKDPSFYIEDLTVSATTLRRALYISGEKKKDSGEVPFGIEVDARAGDGRPAKIKLVRDSETKISRYETGDDFSTVSTFEVSGDQLTVTNTGGGAKSVTHYQRV